MATSVGQSLRSCFTWMFSFVDQARFYQVYFVESECRTWMFSFVDQARFDQVYFVDKFNLRLACRNASTVVFTSSGPSDHVPWQ